MTYDARNRLTNRDDSVEDVHVTPTYDADGNQTETPDAVTRIFHYDPRDRRTSLSQPNAPSLAFDYDPTGQRLRKTNGRAETRYQYGGASLLAENKCNRQLKCIPLQRHPAAQPHRGWQQLVEPRRSTSYPKPM